MTDFTSTAAVATERPGRYAKQLASHFGRKIATGWDEETGEGFLEFPAGRATLAAGDGVLLLAVVAADAEARDRLEGVVGRHLVRFGSKDELVCAWTRTDGTAGSEHRNDDADSASPSQAQEG
ncbi:MAG: DUF2218 domain-containing protein [Propionibacteriaceae bacterium]|nr:DUF2218 domain-containing protein [Propionibacteriaceae bacterium]